MSGLTSLSKTTVAVNLALALSAAGRRVGLVDADLYGPDIPRMMGLRRQAAAASVTVYSGKRGARLEAVDRYGVQQLVFGQRGRKVIVVVVVTPQVVAQQDVRRLVADLGRHPALAVGGIENMAGFTCPCCGTTTPLFPAAPDGESIWAQVSKLASIPFSPKAAADADEGRPVMVTRSVAEQVAAYESAAAQLQPFLDDEGSPDSIDMK